SPESPGLSPLRLNIFTPALLSVRVTDPEVNVLPGLVVVSVKAACDDCHTSPALTSRPTAVPAPRRRRKRGLARCLPIWISGSRRGGSELPNGSQPADLRSRGGEDSGLSRVGRCEDGPVTTGALGLVQRGVGRGEQQGDGAPVRRAAGHADAGRHRYRARRGGDGVPDAFRDV